MTRKILILGGTTEARQLAGRLAAHDGVEVVLSLAGRTDSPAAQGVPVISGGFGGAEGLARHVREDGVDLLVDATHPYAARISANAAEAAKAAGVPIIALRRPPWRLEAGDRWTEVTDVGEAVAALGAFGRRVFLALGRQEVGAFEQAPQHSYVIRSVDPVEPPLTVPDVRYLLARGPFSEADEFELLADNRIDLVVCKNSGGSATYGKIAAAARLGIEVVMIARPALPDVPSGGSVAEVFDMAVHALGPAEKRGV